VEIVDILRVLLRARLLVLAGGLLAVVVGLLAAYQVALVPPGVTSRQTVTGLGVARLQLDTEPSLVTNARSTDITVLGTQARLIADLMASAPVKAEIARGVGIPDAKLLVIGPSMLEPVVPSPLAKRASEVAAAAREPYVLTVGAGLGSELPIITIETVAPTARRADRLAKVAVKGLATSVSSLGSPGTSRLILRPLGAPRAVSKASDSKLPLAFAAAMVLFAMWCGVIVVAAGVGARLRDGAAARRTPALD
jgi:hypothetical protein